MNLRQAGRLCLILQMVEDTFACPVGTKNGLGVACAAPSPSPSSNSSPLLGEGSPGRRLVEGAVVCESDGLSLDPRHTTLNGAPKQARYYCLHSPDDRVAGQYKEDVDDDAEVVGDLLRDTVARYLKCDEEQIFMQRRTKGPSEPAAQWQISWGNTHFYNLFSDADDPPTSPGADGKTVLWKMHNEWRYSESEIETVLVTEGRCENVTWGCACEAAPASPRPAEDTEETEETRVPNALGDGLDDAPPPLPIPSPSPSSSPSSSPSPSSPSPSPSHSPSPSPSPSGPAPTVCEEDFHVDSGACLTCSTGYYKPAGDDYTGPDTVCIQSWADLLFMPFIWIVFSLLAFLVLVFALLFCYTHYCKRHNAPTAPTVTMRSISTTPVHVKPRGTFMFNAAHRFKHQQHNHTRI